MSTETVTGAAAYRLNTSACRLQGCPLGIQASAWGRGQDQLRRADRCGVQGGSRDPTRRALGVARGGTPSRAPVARNDARGHRRGNTGRSPPPSATGSTSASSPSSRRPRCGVGSRAHRPSRCSRETRAPCRCRTSRQTPRGSRTSSNTSRISEPPPARSAAFCALVRPVLIRAGMSHRDSADGYDRIALVRWFPETAPDDQHLPFRRGDMRGIRRRRIPPRRARAGS